MMLSLTHGACSTRAETIRNGLWNACLQFSPSASECKWSWKACGRKKGTRERGMSCNACLYVPLVLCTTQFHLQLSNLSAVCMSACVCASLLSSEFSNCHLLFVRGTKRSMDLRLRGLENALSLCSRGVNGFSASSPLLDF